MEDQFRTKLDELLTQIQKLPIADRERLETLAEETAERRDRMQSAIGDLQTSLDHLRLSVKYLVFDLEATRRENQTLRKLVATLQRRHDEHPNKDAGPDDDSYLQD